MMICVDHVAHSRFDCGVSYEYESRQTFMIA